MQQTDYILDVLASPILSIAPIENQDALLILTQNWFSA